MEKVQHVNDDSQAPSEHDQLRLTTELYFELLKQYAWFSSAGVGAIVLLVQLGSVSLGVDVYVSLALLCTSIMMSLVGQDYLVDSLISGKSVLHAANVLKWLRMASMGCLGIGVGYFGASMFM